MIMKQYNIKKQLCHQELHGYMCFLAKIGCIWIMFRSLDLFLRRVDVCFCRSTMFNILERTISLWILFKDKFLAIFVQTVIFRMTFLAATDMILMHADMLFLDAEFWKQVPPSEPYRVILSDVRDKLYNTRERARHLLASGFSEIQEEATFTDVEQVCKVKTVVFI